MTPSVEMEVLKSRLKATWMSGDYGTFARYLEPGAVEFFRRLNVAPGTRVLDIGCGAGQLALMAARAGANVTGVDIAANLIEQARERARSEGLSVHFDEGDAEALPYPDASFDLVASLIGAMFAPRPELVASEMLRVCRSGGRIAMANWTPSGFIGQMFRTLGGHVPPPANMPPPVQWGDEATVRHRLGEGVTDLQMTRRRYPLRYPFPPGEVVEFFRTYYGPTNRAFAALEGAGQHRLRQDLEQLWSTHNLATDGSTAVDAEYLEVLATRR
jgi:SAM-dependent methyltransferase